MTDYKEGDEVRVFDRRAHRQSRNAYPGTVVSVARKYAIAEYERIFSRSDGTESSQTSTVQFDMATGRERGVDSMYCLLVMSRERAEADDRQAAAEQDLRDVGVRLDSGHSFTLEQIEALAEVVKAWDKGADQ
jgi:hypothetical protein